MKRIIICADGTWNVRDQIDKETGTRRPTNVTKVARAIRPRAQDGTDQVVYYHSGIGTGGPLDKFTGGAFGRGIEHNIREIYRFIVYNFEPGDELYFFGFSRGAFTVRSLAGFMGQVGLIEKDDDYYVPEIYACYESSKGSGSPEWTEAFHNVHGTRPCPPIRFIGVWDTVGALGAPGLLGQVLNKKKYQYHDVGLNPAIQNAAQALAIDERRNWGHGIKPAKDKNKARAIRRGAGPHAVGKTYPVIIGESSEVPEALAGQGFAAKIGEDYPVWVSVPVGSRMPDEKVSRPNLTS